MSQRDPVLESIFGGRVLNATPHDLHFYLPDGTVVTVPRSGIVLRAETHKEDCGSVGTIPVAKATFGAVQGGVPGSVHDHAIVIVAEPVAPALAAALGRRVYVPDTTPDSVVRDDQGRIVGVRGLLAYDPS